MSDDKIIQLSSRDFEEAIDFLNLVFSAHSPHDFATMLPSIYGPSDELMGCNYAIKTDGRIRAIVGLFPINLRVGNVPLRIAGIGGVSTHPGHRAAGYMKSLMHHCVTEMKTMGYQLSWLGGQRQRYLYFGYESCGTKCIFTVGKSNIKHSFERASNVSFSPISSYDKERIAHAVKLHNSQPLYCARSDSNFHDHLVGWHNRPYAALNSRGKMIGYLVANVAGDLIAELCADSTESAIEIVHGWVEEQTCESVTIELHAVPDGLFYGLGRIGEHVRIRESGNWQIFDWTSVTEALLRLRGQCGVLAQGTVAVGITGYGTLRLTVDGDRIECVHTEEDADVTCDGPTAKRLLFGPVSPSLVMHLPKQAELLESWCPLPLSLTRQDWV